MFEIALGKCWADIVSARAESRFGAFIIWLHKYWRLKFWLIYFANWAKIPYGFGVHIGFLSINIVSPRWPRLP
jgi:hypothetical protein